MAALLGTDTAQARAYLRTVQHLAGPVPYHEILAAMRRTKGHEPHHVADLIRQGRAEQPGATQTDES